MSGENPYATPKSSLGVKTDSLTELVSAQRLAIYSMLGCLAVLFPGALIPSQTIRALAGLIGFAGLLIGCARISRALGGGWIMTIMGVLLMFFPIVGLILFISLNVRATRRLKQAGYSVGLLGAKT